MDKNPAASVVISVKDVESNSARLLSSAAMIKGLLRRPSRTGSDFLVHSITKKGSCLKQTNLYLLEPVALTRA